jgi:HEAT repeat protein
MVLPSLANAQPAAPLAGRAARPAMLDLEAPIAQAELVIVVRLTDVSESKIVHGGKQEVVTQQFKFEPVRTLKGIFARDELLLTNSDLRIGRYGEAADQIERGQLLLLLLGRSGPGFFNCNDAGSLEQSIPRLTGPRDALLAAVEALISVTQRRDREARVHDLLEALKKAGGADAIPLLASLQRRGLLAAQTPHALEAIAPWLKDPSPAVREAAARTLAAVLDADYLNQKELRSGSASAILGALDVPGADLAARVTALEALGAVGESLRGQADARDWLRADRATRTFAERSARLRAIGRIGLADQKPAVATAFDGLPLDVPDTVLVAAGETLTRLDPAEALKHLRARINAKLEAGMGIATEITLLGHLPRADAAGALVEVARQPLDVTERLALAMACQPVADPRLVPALAALLDPRQGNVRWQAIEALKKIDTDEAASVLRPHLGEEDDLASKLDLAEFLGRHGLKSGYAYAIEHMSEPSLRDRAIAVLAAVREPKAIPELRKIWETSHDLAWNAAAIRALGRLGQAEIAPRLLPIARDAKDPLAPSALIALGDLGRADALPAVREGLTSRSDDLVIAAARAAAKILALPDVPADDVRDRLASLLADPSASQAVRIAALEALVALGDPRLGASLLAAARDAGLEGSELLRRVEERLAARKEKLDLL